MISALAYTIGKEVTKWDTTHRRYLSYVFDICASDKDDPFLIVCIDGHQARFSVDENNVENILCYGKTVSFSSDIMRLLTIIVKSIARQVIEPLLSLDITSVPPVVLFPRLTRRFFDDLTYLTGLTHPHSPLVILDIEDYFRLPELFTSPTTIEPIKL